MKALGIDYGERRIGLSFGDTLGLAVPIPAAVEPSEAGRLAHLDAVIRERGITHLVVGMPYNMNGSSGFKAKEVETFIETLKSRFHLPVTTVDERLTSHQVEQELKLQKRKVDRRSGLVDSRAAALILQDFLDQILGQNPGIPDEDWDP